MRRSRLLLLIAVLLAMVLGSGGGLALSILLQLSTRVTIPLAILIVAGDVIAPSIGTLLRRESFDRWLRS